MPRLPRVTARALVRALERDGWQQTRQAGSHLQMTHPNKPGRVTIPLHQGQTLKVKLLASVLKQAGLTVDEFIALL
jgi:predicted RNA binding protein YcfA (HicA-like mRNA interferase family)